MPVKDGASYVQGDEIWSYVYAKAKRDKNHVLRQSQPSRPTISSIAERVDAEPAVVKEQTTGTRRGRPTVGARKRRPLGPMIDWNAVFDNLPGQFTVDTISAYETAGENSRSYLRQVVARWSIQFAHDSYRPQVTVAFHLLSCAPTVAPFP